MLCLVEFRLQLMNMWNRHHFRGPPANEQHEIMKVNSRARLAPVSNGGGGRAGLRSEEEGSSSDLQNLKLCCFDVAPGIFNSSASLLTGGTTVQLRGDLAIRGSGPL